MTRGHRDTPTLLKLVSVPGLAVIAILGIAVIALSRLFGPENILREVLMEVVASLGSTILVLAIFGLFFRSGLERLLREAPGGETLAESANRLGEVLQDLDQQNQKMVRPADEAKLDRIEQGVRSLAEDGIRPLKEEIEELRKLILDSK
ncbi:MAG: hypothetical protein M3305_13325 [Actinomycetota bacterium]|nr:hypothetical protein [Actinomycetota bacterium]